MSEIPFDPESLFPPKPGGMVDTVRRQRQAEQDQLDQLAEQPDTAQPSKVAVPVADHGSDLARARTFSISTSNNNPIVELLGQDKDRRNATIMTLDEPIVLSFSQQAAEDPRNAANAAGLSANGFVLPIGTPVMVNYQGIVYATATSGTATRVCVMAFSYAET